MPGHFPDAHFPRVAAAILGPQNGGIDGADTIRASRTGLQAEGQRARHFRRAPRIVEKGATSLSVTRERDAAEVLAGGTARR
jgi:hypothetical protein